MEPILARRDIKINFDVYLFPKECLSKVFWLFAKSWGGVDYIFERDLPIIFRNAFFLKFVVQSPDLFDDYLNVGEGVACPEGVVTSIHKCATFSPDGIHSCFWFVQTLDLLVRFLAGVGSMLLRNPSLRLVYFLKWPKWFLVLNVVSIMFWLYFGVFLLRKVSWLWVSKASSTLGLISVFRCSRLVGVDVRPWMINS